jgi:hypothetical protein
MKVLKDWVFGKLGGRAVADKETREEPKYGTSCAIGV